MSSYVTSLVADQYTRFSYPHYPLLASPKWQDGYLAAPQFARLVCQKPHRPLRRVLIAGCGEILPRIMAAFVPRETELVIVDLSQKSLRRAIIRLNLIGRTATAVHEPLEGYLADCKKQQIYFDHIDCYGVLHCLPEPQLALDLMADCLRSDGTMRIMVYNHIARNWITTIQRILKACHMMRTPNDLKRAMTVVRDLERHIPLFQHYLRSQAKDSFRSPDRFVDMFLPAREIRFDAYKWHHCITQSGLTIQGLYDRYGELDDLPNPFRKAPSADQLAVRCQDLRFENNFEWYLSKEISQKPLALRPVKAPKALGIYASTTTPRHSRGFTETASLSCIDHRKLWHQLWHYLTTGETWDCDNSWPLATQKRLARQGYLTLPHLAIHDPLSKTSTPPNPCVKGSTDDITLCLDNWLREAALTKPQLRAALLNLIDRCQNFYDKGHT